MRCSRSSWACCFPARKLKWDMPIGTLPDVRGDTLDHQTQTALLDARLVAGDAALFQQFQAAYSEHLHVADFLFRKEAERAEGSREMGRFALCG